LSAGRPIPGLILTTTDASRRRKAQPKADRPGEPTTGRKKSGAAPSVPELAAMGEAHRPGCPSRFAGVALSTSILSPAGRRCRIATARDPLACCGGGPVAGGRPEPLLLGRATLPAAPLMRSYGRWPPRRTASWRSSSGARLTLRRQHRGDALRRKGLSALVQVPLGGQRLRDRPQTGTPLPLGLGKILRPLDDLWARLGVALATVDLDAGRAFAPARSRQLTSNAVFSFCDTPR
jgi:hypothetical protein